MHVGSSRGWETGKTRPRSQIAATQPFSMPLIPCRQPCSSEHHSGIASLRSCRDPRQAGEAAPFGQGPDAESPS
ncbi:hypothetical protein Cob_v000680 [Colletotrichum orbiculare MAFF 240422]|uniref:Uncharacterized protein n=1 Tax=Colletotrichum orbiculare (strain 104-T / ATCC 96160 / CBS 514.97 / LARS 414 / MAFF 240422) TaxID=1213857 RepID=A0A484G9T0_COLOR|nr:hypothetical protein Cob_v000680 [Colletotrichum orbiculare MAFF 240422]